jgi:multidrug efflux pump subunit AcrB
VLSVWLLHGEHDDRPTQPGLVDRAKAAYVDLVKALVRMRWAVIAVYALLCALTLALITQLGTELFARVDTGQLQLRIRAQPGTRLEKTEEIVKDVDAAIRAEAGPNGTEISLANIGNPAWTYPVNGLYVFNAGPQEALLLASLVPSRHASMPVFESRLRDKLKASFPGVAFSFEPGDIVSQVLNFGATSAVEVNVSGKKLGEVRAHANKILAELGKVTTLRDVQIPQALDYPTFDVDIDRERAGQLGVTVDRVSRSVVDATFSSALTTPVFWTDPATGVAYRVAVRVPENQVQTAQDLLALPVMNDGAPRPLLADVAKVGEGTTPGQVTHYNSQRTVSVTANVVGGDLGGAARAVEAAIQRAGDAPRGVTVAVRGQVEQMRTTLTSLQAGLGLAVIVVLLLLAANFQSFRDPLVALSTTPAVLAGVVVVLFATRTTLNVQSMMGAVMSIGVSVANAVLLVTFARDRWFSGTPQPDAATEAAAARVRPILMTALAMIAGMLPMALGVGEGGEQSAPLGRAVIGGLVASTVATLLVLPAMYVVLGRGGDARPASLAPPEEPLEATS